MQKFAVCIVGLIAAAIAAAVGADGALCEIELVTGEVLRGTRLPSDAGRFLFEHPVLGVFAIDRAKITRVRDIDPLEAAAPAEQSQATDEPAGRVASAGETAEQPIADDAGDAWTFSLDIGASGAWGNTQHADARGGFRGDYENDERRIMMDATYYYSSSGGDTDTNKFVSGVRHDWLLKRSPWFVFGQVRFDADEFTSWDWRVAGHAGAGYTILDNDAVTLRWLTGLGATYEEGWYDDGMHSEAMLGPEVDWIINDRQSVAAYTYFYPRLDKADARLFGFRSVTGIDWIFDLSEKHGLHLKIGAYNEYQSERDDDVVKNDLKLYGGLMYSF